MTDKQKKLVVSHLINSAQMLVDGPKRKRLGSFYLDIENKPGLRVVRDRNVVFDVKSRLRVSSSARRARSIVRTS